MLSCSPVALHAETSNEELAQEIKALRAQIREMKSAISETRGEARRANAKIKAVASRTPYEPAMPSMVIPTGATPAFVTADKKLQFGAITITPGGFVAAESVFRSRTQQADIGSAYQNIPFGPQANTNEFRFSARQSRASLLAEGAITPTMIASGYGELDFLGSGVTSNENESNSFVPRIRHLYGTLDMGDYGVHFLAGQTWSLATLNSKGITPRNEVTPPTIDAQYVPGFVWKRQPQVRLVKDFGKSLWVAVSAEQPQTTYGGSIACAAGFPGSTIPLATGSTNTAVSSACQLPGNNNLNNTTNFSINHIPDAIGKVVYEAHVADRDVHFEGFGMYRDLYNRVQTTNNIGLVTANNTDGTGYGVGGGLIVPVLPKRLDFQVTGLTGRGIGSYGTAQFADATFRSDGSGSPIHESMLLAGLTLHATPAIDVYAFGGVEQVAPDYYSTNAAGSTFTGAGYGLPTANNSQCFNTVNAGLNAGGCSGNTKRIWQITGGMWDKIYKGSFGEVRVGVQYSYSQRELFQGNAPTTPVPATATTAQVNALPFSPKQNEQAVLTSIRYYPFQ